jgi:hypothetical protein
MKTNATIEVFIDVRREIVSATRRLLPIFQGQVARLCGRKINIGVGELAFAWWYMPPIY